VFVGHFALGYAAKRVAPRVSLAVLFIAAEFADLLWPVLVGVGVEHVRIVAGDNPFLNLAFDSYPYSHSLLMLVIWGMGLAAVYRAVTGDRAAMPVLFALVVSHWLLDVVTHRPDMPVVPHGATYGLGLWSSVAGTLAVEFAMFAAGVWIYARATRPRDRIGTWSFVGFVLLLAISYVASLGPPPPSVTAVWTFTLVGAALTLALSWWSDRHRAPTSAH
jgi:hypothetical protein